MERSSRFRSSTFMQSPERCDEEFVEDNEVVADYIQRKKQEGMINIMGDGQIPEAAAFYDVRDVLSFEQDITLCAHVAPLFGIELNDVAIYNMEPLYDGCRSFSIGYFETLKRCHVLDYSARNVAYLRGRGIESFHMPYGYHESLKRAVPTAKDIDVLCIGSINQRRSILFERLEKEFNFAWVQGVYGEARDALIAKVKVHVNVHYCDAHPLEVVRLNYLMANHCNIVSEAGNEDEVNQNYAPGLRFSRYDGLIASCHHALMHPVDGHDIIKRMPHDCAPAQRWLNARGA